MDGTSHGFQARFSSSGYVLLLCWKQKRGAEAIVEEHLDICLEAGLSLTGINAEVLLGQWEYQCFGKGAKKSADDLWISGFCCTDSEEYGLGIELHPKLLKGGMVRVCMLIFQQKA